jgi:outer membrane receptor protein involved in Fe transport
MTARTLNVLAPAVIAAMSLIANPLQAQPGGLEEVIVTAEKRATSIQDTPIAVTAFTGEELDRALISKPLDMQFSVPNMLMSKGNFTTASISIRGIGNQAIGAQSDSGTGVHFNGVYLNGGRIFETEFFDAERVEVLRGPQGTLYGRNTTAGVVNMITNKPTDEFGGDVQLELGDYSHVKFKGAVNLPITDNLAQRFALFYHERDGFVENNLQDGVDYQYDSDDIDDRDMYAIRSATRWSDDRLDATLTVNYFEEDDSRMRGSNQRCLRDDEGILGCLPTGLAAERTNGAATVTALILDAIAGPFYGVTFPDDDFANSNISGDPRDQYLDFTPQYEVEDLMVSFELNYDFDDFKLTSLTGYHSSDLDARNDYDFAVASEAWDIDVTFDRGPDGPITVNRLYSSDRSTTEPEQISQEFRLTSDFDGDWNFLVGAFYLEYESDVHYYIYSSALTAAAIALGEDAVDPNFRAFDNDTSDYELETWAVFGELYWQTTDTVNMTLGLRYTEEEKSSQNRVVYLSFLDDPTAADGGYTEYSGDWSDPTGKFNVTWDVNDDVMTYLTLSRSYKSGGFNPISSESGLPTEFDPEFINSFEVGAKTRFLDNTLQANVTYFYYDYEDLQIAKITNQIALNENFDAAIQGFEGEFVWLPVESLRLTANVAWLDTEMDGGESVDTANINLLGTTENIVTGPNANTYVGPCPPGVTSCPDGLPTQLDGNSLPNSPEFSVNLGIAYFFHLDNGMELVAATNYYWQDEFYTRVFNAPNDKLDEWDVWNATLTLYSADQTWFAELWGRNLQDEDHVTGQYLSDQNVGLATNQFLLEPRMVGVTLGYTF